MSEQQKIINYICNQPYKVKREQNKLVEKSIESNLELIQPLFKQHKVEKAYLFGSAISGNFSNKSDLDFIIKFQPNIPPLKRGELWWGLHDQLREFFKREIDLVTEDSLKNPYFIKELNKTKQLIYG